eukprot:11477429-Alexandrium_andersonii.AAC.1
MSASLVGSEMCIRDRPSAVDSPVVPAKAPPADAASRLAAAGPVPAQEAVSYTHLTLPTICSV